MIDREKWKELWGALAQETYETVCSKGFTHDNPSEAIALMHSELSEALEAMREGRTDSTKIPPFSALEAELADTVIRIMDHGWAHGLDVAGAIVAKVKYNATRAHRHGGKKF